MKPICLFDMDNTLADYNKALLQDLQGIAGPNDPPINLDAEQPDWLQRRIVLARRQPGWWRALGTLKSGLEILEVAKDIGFDIHILTKGPSENPRAWTEKVQWVYDELGTQVPVTITNKKGLVYGRVLVDDWPAYLKEWLEHRPRGACVMPAQSYNKDFCHPQVFRYTNSDDKAVLWEVLSAAYNRKSEDGA